MSICLIGRQNFGINVKNIRKGLNLQKGLWSVGAAKISGYAGDLQKKFLLARLERMRLLREQWNAQSVQKSSKVTDIFKIEFLYRTKIRWTKIFARKNYQRLSWFPPSPVYQRFIVTPLRRLTCKNVYQIWYFLIWAIQGMFFLDF